MMLGFSHWQLEQELPWAETRKNTRDTGLEKTYWVSGLHSLHKSCRAYLMSIWRCLLGGWVFQFRVQRTEPSWRYKFRSKASRTYWKSWDGIRSPTESEDRRRRASITQPQGSPTCKHWADVLEENIRALETQQSNCGDFSLNPYLHSTHPFMLKFLFPFISLLLYYPTWLFILLISLYFKGLMIFSKTHILSYSLEENICCHQLHSEKYATTAWIGGELGENRYMYMYAWVPVLFTALLINYTSI